MTNREALVAEVGLPAEDKMIDKALTDAEINAVSPYTKANQSLISQAAVQVLRVLKSTKSITQGGFTIALDAAAIEARILELTGYPIIPTTGQAAIQNKSFLW